MSEEAVAGIAFELSFDGYKMDAGIKKACKNIKNNFEKAFSKVEDNSRNSSEKVQKSFKDMRKDSEESAEKIKNNFLSSFSTIAKKAATVFAGAFAIGKIKEFGARCLELGSDLAEVQNVVDVTFPHMTAQVDKFAQAAAQSFGLSETMAKQYTGTFGAMAKAFGFTENQAYDMATALTGLTGDVASFYNLNQDEAYTKLKSVFTGETESLKDLGVVMTQTALDAYAMANGYGKTTSAMTEAEKVSLRYAFVQDQLSAATGDFARTSGSWANQVRILKLQMESFMATVGQGLINLFTPALKMINTLIGKLATLANAFKSFTELITGQKSSGSSQITASVGDLSDTAQDAQSGLDGAAGAADNLSSSTKKAGDAAQKAARKMKSLMGFDKINRLDASNDSAGSNTGGTGGTTGAGQVLGQQVDFGKLAEGETELDKADSKFSVLIERAKELAALFKKGFKIGFGDSEKKIKSINNGITSIGKNLKKIFTDKNVTKAAEKCLDSIAVSAGKTAGSFVRVGLTLGDNLIGGIDSYLGKSRERIKKRIISLFNVQSDIAVLVGDFTEAFADVFDIFSSAEAKGITADIIQIFADGFLGVTDLEQKFSRDTVELLVTPFTENAEKIKTVLEGVLGRWQIVFDTLAQSVTDTFDKIDEVYNLYFKPFIDSITQGITDILGIFLDAWNTYISPVLDYLAEKFSVVWQEHIQPALNGILELIGKVFELLGTLWNELLVPFIEWMIQTILPTIAPIISNLGELALDLLKVAGDVISGITKILSGILDFLTGVFSGNWGKTWNGIEEILMGFKKIADSVLEFVQKYILDPFISYVTDVFATDWSESFGTLGAVLNTFLDSVKTVLGDVRDLFHGIITFITGTFAGDWEKAWNGICEIFGSIFHGLGTLAKTPLNMVIDLVNGLMNKLNSGLSAIENAFSFSYDFKNPITGTRHYGHYGLSLPRVPEIPHLAQGGYVKPNTPQLAMIGDNRHQGEIVAPEDKLRQMAAEAVREAGGSGVTKTELEQIMNRAVMRIVAALSGMGFYIDGEQMARVMQAVNRSMDVRYNPVETE